MKKTVACKFIEKVENKMRGNKEAEIDHILSNLLEIIENKSKLSEENQQLRDFIKQVIEDYTLEVKVITLKVN